MKRFYDTCWSNLGSRAVVHKKAPLDLWTRRNQNQKSLVAYWLAACQIQSEDRIFWIWFLLVHKSNGAKVSAVRTMHACTRRVLRCLLSVQTRDQQATFQHGRSRTDPTFGLVEGQGAQVSSQVFPPKGPVSPTIWTYPD